MIDKFFPFKKIRDCQKEILDKIIENWDNHSDFIIEAPTGIGKSAIAVALCRMFEDQKAWILTTQKLLQSQYVNDFGDLGLTEIKSKENYCCKRDNCNCLEGRAIATSLAKLTNYKGNSAKFYSCLKDCNYIEAKVKFLNSPISITNYSYFLNAVKYTEDIETRGLMICDECHSVEKNIMDFIEIEFSEGFATNVLHIDKNMLPKDEENFMAFLSLTYKTRLAGIIAELKAKMTDCADRERLSISKLYTKYDRHMCKLNRFLEAYALGPKNWIFEIGEEKKFKEHNILYTFKPLFINMFANDNLFIKANKRIYFSATVISKKNFCNSLGLDEEKTFFMSVGSPFKVENRPIRYTPIAKMSYGNVDGALSKIVDEVDRIVGKFPNEKGIIHTNNYKIAKYIKENTEFCDRMLIHNSENRADVLNEHMESKESTILLSPSMAEGVDLRDDFSRFQIVCKIPFPFLGDKRISMRKDVDEGWYFTEAIKILCQAVGRSIRNEEDFADTYILDASFEFLYRRNKSLFPKWFKEAVILF